MSWPEIRYWRMNNCKGHWRTIFWKGESELQHYFEHSFDFPLLLESISFKIISIEIIISKWSLLSDICTNTGEMKHTTRSVIINFNKRSNVCIMFIKYLIQAWQAILRKAAGNEIIWCHEETTYQKFKC